MSYAKPIPVPDERSAPFWSAARRHRLAIQRCQSCRAYAHPPEIVCPRCQHVEFAFEEVSGRGRVKAWTIMRQPFAPGFGEEVPFVNAIVELEEQPWLNIMATLVDGADARIAYDDPVQVVFEDVTPEVTLPKFRLARRNG